ncbi:DUF2642 domain-containing protein [Bacillus sp. FJAT-42376]|uniref:DUF2642 domain-containing protein n=1 Tax=Bacillus sp. FJAT-42376 TaxID=2014076 RepID=UPI0013DE2343|nr:DUF2642 domain-containing protein [Bacillus sp. FJAT-42376]
MKQNQNSRYWKTYVGETVKINRGGPEAKKGRLLDLGTDFLVLAVEKPGPKSPVVYYQLHHVKSVTSESNAEQEEETAAEEAENEVPEEAEKEKEGKTQEIPDYYFSRSFRSLLRMHAGEQIQINQGGPDSVKGLLLDVKSDYVIVKSKKDILYISMYHIKSVAGIVSKDDKNGNNQEEDCGCEDEYYLAHSYDRLFQVLKGTEIAVHSGGPEKAEGMLNEHTKGRYVLEGKKEAVIIEPGHVRSIKAKNANNEENSEENSSQEAAENGNQNQNNSAQSDEQKSKQDDKRREPERDRVYTQVTKTVDFHWKR